MPDLKGMLNNLTSGQECAARDTKRLGDLD